MLKDEPVFVTETVVLLSLDRNRMWLSFRVLRIPFEKADKDNVFFFVFRLKVHPCLSRSMDQLTVNYLLERVINQRAILYISFSHLGSRRRMQASLF